jgi:lipopolysaccharide/colanic/teichoic acid biosynthesis glycosyltransferase
MQRSHHGSQVEAARTRMDEHTIVVSAPRPAASRAPAGAVAVGATGVSRGAPRRVDSKRLLDVIVAVLTLLILAPVMGVIALLIKLDSAGPVFYRASRVGHRGQTLRMLKFRKMQDRATGSPLTMDDDARFTRIGGWLAKLKLDELPQLWHVLTGEMSLVGPRPETEGFVARHEAEYREILSVRPGILGWSQLAFAEESRILDDRDPIGHYVAAILPQKLDLLYAKTRTALLDLRILFWSVLAVVLRRRVAVHRSDGRMNLRRR